MAFTDMGISLLVRLFSERTPFAGGSPYSAMSHHVRQLQAQVGSGSRVLEFEPYLAARGVGEIRMDPALPCDGCVEPIGRSYEEGFRLVLKRASAPTRMRFTIAHEICHTFFYEVVPELKFAPHETDSLEERLCNVGAAELLIPADDLHAQASRLAPSLLALEELARDYAVSMEAMALRLRVLRLWESEISFWHRKTGGSFVLDRIYGSRADWTWVDQTPLQKAWQAGRSEVVQGRTFVDCEDGQHRYWAKRVNFQAKRHGDGIVVLWSGGPFVSAKKDLPLFRRRRRSVQQPTPGHMQRKTVCAKSRGAS